MILDPVIEKFLAERRLASAKVLILDYDGTLAPFSEDRLRAFPDPSILHELQNIIDDGATRLAFLSGRSALEVRQLLSLSVYPEIWGSHGREKLSKDGHLDFYGLPKDAEKNLRSLAELIKREIDSSRVEMKTGCIAIHWRGAKEVERNRMLSLIEKDFKGEISERGLDVKPFNGGVELSQPGRNKGDVVSEIIGEYPSGSIAVAYLGDDDTDEDAFKAVNGKGLSILVANQSRSTNAQCRISFPEAVADFLRMWHLWSY
jgi:trehalose 6-phosphate phosphatase